MYLICNKIVTVGSLQFAIIFVFNSKWPSMVTEFIAHCRILTTFILACPTKHVSTDALPCFGGYTSLFNVTNDE